MIELQDKKVNTSPRFFMILSVPLALFCTLLVGFLGFIPLKAELHSVVIVFLILLIFLFFISHNAWYSFAKYKNSLGEIIKKIDEHLLKNELIISGQKKSFANIDSFFETHLKNIRNDNFASVAASIFPTLGILGTFTAIAISMPNFTVDSKEALENEITILLSGVGTAFYASIYGIFLSIWWVFFEKRGQTKIQSDVEELKQQYQSLIWTKDEIELLKLANSGNDLKEVVNKIESIVTPEFVYKLDSVAQAKLDLIEKLDNEYRNTEQKLVQNYLKINKLFEESSKRQEELFDNFSNLLENTNSVNEKFEQMKEENIKNQKAVKAEIYSVLSSFELVSSDLKGLGKSLIEQSNKNE